MYISYIFTSFFSQILPCDNAVDFQITFLDMIKWFSKKKRGWGAQTRHPENGQNLVGTGCTLQWRNNERLESPASRLLAQPFVQALIEDKSKTPHHWPLWPVDSYHKGLVTRKIFPFDDVIVIR